MDNQGDQFDQWNEQKKKIQAKVAKKTYAKNIYWVCVGYNVWHEIYENLQALHAPYWC